jgi:hypothetical protein
VAFDTLLFRPWDVVWPEKAPNRDGELHAGTGIRRNQSLVYCNVQNPPKYPQLLMNGRWLEGSSFSVPESGFDERALAHAFPKIRFNIVGADVEEFAARERGLQMLNRAKVRDACFLCAVGRLGIVLHESVHPLPEEKAFSPTDNLQNVLVAGIKP